MRNASWCKILLYRCDVVAQYVSFDFLGVR